jgi:hypothetical protein
MQIVWGVAHRAEDGKAGVKHNRVFWQNDGCYIEGYNVKFIRRREPSNFQKET